MGRVLVLDFDKTTRIASCWWKDDWKFLRVKIDDGAVPHQGQYLQLDSNRTADATGLIHVSHVTIKNAQREDCHRYERSRFLLSAWLAFSDDPAHPTHTRQFAFADWYGIVDCAGWGEKTSADFKVFTANIVVNDLNFAENGTKLFKVENIRFAVTGKKAKEAEELVEKMNMHFSIEKEWSRHFDSAHDQNTQKREASSAPSAIETNARPVSPQPSPAVLDRLSRLRVDENEKRRVPSPVESPILYPPTPQTRRDAPRPESVICECAVVMLQNASDLIVWLCDVKQPAVLKDSQIRAGASIQCRYIPTRREYGVKFQVIEVLRKLQTLPFTIEEFSPTCFLAVLEVDLSSPNMNFRDWMWLTETPVFNAPQVGFCTGSDIINCPDRRDRPWQHMMRMFVGSANAKEMMGYCMLKKQRVPRGVANANADGTGGGEGTGVIETETRYVWRLIAVVGQKDIAFEGERRQWNENVGPNSREYKEEDAMARAIQEMVDGKRQ